MSTLNLLVKWLVTNLVTFSYCRGAAYYSTSIVELSVLGAELVSLTMQGYMTVVNRAAWVADGDAINDNH